MKQYPVLSTQKKQLQANLGVADRAGRDADGALPGLDGRGDVTAPFVPCGRQVFTFIPGELEGSATYGVALERTSPSPPTISKSKRTS